MTIKKELQQLDKTDLLRILWYVRYKRVIYKISTLHPARFVIPVVVLQIIATMIHLPISFLLAVICNIIIVGIALLPFALRRPKSPRYHWLKNNDTTLY